jgi:hypothetical protein
MASYPTVDCLCLINSILLSSGLESSAWPLPPGFAGLKEGLAFEKDDE